MVGSSVSAYAGVMCQYDPECPVHRHRPGTTCPVVYRKQRAAIKAKQRRKAMCITIIMYAIIIAFFIAIHMHPEMLRAIGDWIAGIA